MTRVTRALCALSALAASLLAGIGAQRRPAASVSEASPADAPVEVAAPQPAQAPRRAAVTPAAPSPAARRAPAPEAAPASAAQRLVPRALPASLAAATMSEWGSEQLAALDEQTLAMLDYKLGVLSRLRGCLTEHGLAEQPGKLSVFLRYQLDETTRQARGSGVELLDSSLSSDVDTGVTDCLKTAHVDFLMPWHDALPRERDFHWATDFALPLEDDGAYAYFAR